ncbi:MAG TPA: DUF72 domain-containing protein [Allosphingosinicella sp.]|nr:DUF72 domain-containing protein [Allosphingosinicella sp.]
MAVVIGTAGWSIPAREAAHFPPAGSALQRYSARFAGVEINSSFHRPHRDSTWRRWAESVPDGFRFAVKLPRSITHQRKLVDCSDLTAPFLEQVAALGDRLAVLLVQLPPSLAFDPNSAARFLEALAGAAAARIVCEPRHPSWFEDEADALLDRLGVARAAADPAVVPAAAFPGGHRSLAYWRLHGSPAIYRSSYDEARLSAYAELVGMELRRRRDVWCMFDNTASSAATANALELMERI